MHDDNEAFNQAFRKAAGKEPPPEPETPAEPEPTVTRGVRGVQVHKEGFNEALRRIRGFGE